MDNKISLLQQAYCLTLAVSVLLFQGAKTKTLICHVNSLAILSDVLNLQSEYKKAVETIEILKMHSLWIEIVIFCQH